MKGMYNGVTMKLHHISPHILSNSPNLSKNAQLRLSWIDWYLSNGKNARLTCRHFGITPDTFYRWKNRFNPKNISSLEDDFSNRKPKNVRTMTTSNEIIAIVKHIRSNDIEKSKNEIQEELKRKNIHVGTSTIQKIINKHHLYNTQHITKIKKRRNLSIKRIKASIELKEKYPGALIQIDTKHLYVLNKRFYVFVAVDCKSRIGYTSAFKTGTSSNASLFLEEFLNYIPFDVNAIQTDNGSEYLGFFHKKCTDLNIKHYFTDPHCPKQNGRAERFIQTAVYEYFNYQYDLMDDVDQIKDNCMRFNFKYNNRRFHQSLGYKTPMEYLENNSNVELSKILDTKCTVSIAS